jgi:hypothetical protein
MKQTFEAQILAYLDGGLSEHEREELLHVLSVSPEKRAMLDQHLQLRSALRAGERPFSAPLSVQRSLASRIPVLAEEYPELTHEAEYMAQRVYARPSAFRRALRYITAFASQWSLQAGLAFGGSLVLVSGVTWKIASDVTKGNISNEQSSRRAVTRQIEPKDVAVTPRLEYVPQTQMPLANGVQSGPAAGLIESPVEVTPEVKAEHDGISSVTPRGTEHASANGVKSSLPVKRNTVNAAHRENVSAQETQMPLANSVQPGPAAGLIESSAATPAVKTNHDGISSVTPRNSEHASLNGVKSSLPASRNTVNAADHVKNVPSSNSNNDVSTKLPSAEPTNAANSATPIAQNSASIVEDERIQNIAQVPYRDVVSDVKNVSLASNGMRIRPIEMDEPTSASFAGHIEFSNTSSSLLQTGTDGRESLKSTMKQSIVGGIDYIINPNVSIGVEAGVGSFSQASNTANEVQIARGLRSRNVESSVSIVSAPWTRALVRYTVNPADAVRFEVNGGAGSAFINGPALTAAAGVRASYDVAPGMSGIAQIGYGATWVQQARDNASIMDPSSNAITGIVNHEKSNRTLTSGALDIRVGIGLSL